MPDNTGDEFFADCAVVVTGRFVNQRVAPCPLEVRGSAVAWVPSDDGSIGCTNGSARKALRAHATRSWRATVSTAEELNVITPDVGGGFGAKITCYPEEILLGQLAKPSAVHCAGARPAPSR